MYLFLSCIFHFAVKIRTKRVTERNWTYKVYLLTEETSSWFPLIETLKITCAKSYVWFLNFYQIERVWIFSQQVLPKLSKVTVTCPQSVKLPNRDSFDLPKVSKVNIRFELLKVSKITNLKSLYLQSWRS